LVLLGILVERTGLDLRARVPELVKAVRPDWPQATALAAAYLLAHFPSEAVAIESALAVTTLSEEDLSRLRRCLARPGSTAPNQIGRVWPSPALWTLDAAEGRLDRQWRATLSLSADTVGQLWESETTALLAFMGAKAEHAIGRTIDA
jgi:hypothetical protein